MTETTTKIDAENLEVTNEIKRRYTKTWLLAQKAKIEAMLAKFEDN